MKYNNKKIHAADGIFDSQKEYRRWCDLKILEKAGQIQALDRQVRYELIPKMGKNRPTTFIADFVYREKGKVVVEDAKGFRTEVYRIKKKLMAWVHKIDVREI